MPRDELVDARYRIGVRFLFVLMIATMGVMSWAFAVEIGQMAGFTPANQFNEQVALWALVVFVGIGFPAIWLTERYNPTKSGDSSE